MQATPIFCRVCVLNIAITTFAITFSCKQGEFFSETNNKCIKCPEKCNNCNSTDNCLACKTGYTGVVCEHACSNCLHGTPCQQHGGFCEHNCSEGLSGYNCTVKCDPSCKSCDRLNNKNCFSCAHNRFGNNCKEKCSVACINNTCNDTDGACTLGCSAGYWGKQCTYCSHCEENVCGKTGECLNSTNQTSREKSGGSLQEEHIGLIIALSIIAIIIFVIIYIVIKRKKFRQCTVGKDSDDVLKRAKLAVGLRPACEKSTGSSVPLVPLYSTVSKRHHKMQFSLQADIHNETNSTISQKANQFLEINPEEINALDSPEKNVNDLDYAEEEPYYNTAALIKRKIPIDNLADYVSKKTTNDFDGEFKELPRGLIKPYTESQKEENIRKNRYKGFYPYDETRVVIKEGDSDFINASFIDGHKQFRAYIASLGPTKEFMGDISVFWKMVWQENCGKIIMLTNLQEAQVCKCDQYWPNEGLSDMYADIKVSCDEERKFKTYVLRFLSIESKSEKREIVQFHFTAWPDKGVPDDIQGLIRFRREINNFKTKLNGPVLVHCSAGVGRTGTYIALDILTREGEAEGCVDIFACVCNLREQRVKMVQTAAQYEFLHHALVYSLNRQTNYVPGIR